MYNSFIAGKKHQDIKVAQSQQKRIHSWFSKYKTEVQPNLVSNFNKRIHGFAKKMEDEPFPVYQQQHPLNLFRLSNRKLNLTQTSIRAATNNIDRSTQNRSAFHKSLDQSARNRYEQPSPIKYENKRTQYRSREKQKQIQPPMKFNGMLSKHRFKAKNKAKLNGRTHTEEDIRYKNANISRQSYESDGRQSDFGSISDIDLMSLYNYSFSKRKDHRKTELQLIQQKQLKQLAHSRLYFKSLLELAHSSKTRKQKEDIRETLRKCKIIKNPAHIKTKDEVDRLIELLKN